MNIPRCAASWLVHIAKNLVQSGAENPGVPTLAWVPNWNTALHWVQTPTYSVLAYQCDGTFDETMQMQLLDAFSRSCHKKLVSIVDETDRSALCFFGGAPQSIQLPTIDFTAKNSFRNSLPHR